MARHDWYTVKRATPKDDFEVLKFNRDQDLEITYRVGPQGGDKAICECIAGAKFCRHKKMVDLFVQQKLVNSNRLYNFDKDKWFDDTLDLNADSIPEM